MMVIAAAGGVLWRQAAAGVEVAVVHRPRYDDWTLPKGKLDPGEDHVSAALREVEEETGVRPRLGAPLGEVRYHVDKRGQRGEKVVRYWAMTAETASTFTPNKEVDEVRWLPAADAEWLLSYDRDRQVLARFTATLASPR